MIWNVVVKLHCWSLNCWGRDVDGVSNLLTIVLLETYHGTQSDVLWQTIVFVFHWPNSLDGVTGQWEKNSCMEWGGECEWENDVDY